MKILGLIPARKGSKGVKGKNMRKLRGKPLLEYTLDSAKKSNVLDDILLSTDCIEMLNLGEKYKCLNNGLRPSRLSSDESLTIDVVLHELIELSKKNYHYDAIILLQPTCPLRTSQMINDAIKIFTEHKAESLISVVNVGGYHPLRMKLVHENQLYNYIDTGIEDMRPRQELPPVYIRNGAIYISKTENLLESKQFGGGKCVPFIMDEAESVNIDSERDMIYAELLLSKK